MMTDKPLVTVYIPTYNRVELLKRAVESVRNQTYKNIEIIIVDDCSQDDTALYLEEIARQDSRISYYLKEKNSGACASRNIAINNAQGEYITGLDDDDIFLPERVEIFIKYSKKYDMSKTILFSGYSDIERDITLKTRVRLFLEKKIVKQKDLILRNFIGNQVFVKTSLLRKVGGFDESFEMWQDLDCWYRLLAISKAKLIPVVTYKLDVDHGYERITNQDKLKRTYNKFCEKHKLSDKEQRYLTLHFPHYGINVNKKLLFKRAFKTKNCVDFYSLLQYLINKNR